MKIQTKNRSPYAKSLELKQYRHRVQEHKRVDFDDWVEDALEEYWRDRNNGREETSADPDTEADQASSPSPEQTSDSTRESTGKVVDIRKDKNE